MLHVDYRILIESLGMKINDPEVFNLAITHSSCNGAAKTKHHDYERLEFLGDAIIGMVVSELVYEHFKDLDQGSLTMVRAKFVCGKNEARIAKKLGFPEFVRLGNSFEKNSESLRAVYEDVFEAFIGAICVDQDLDTAIRVTRKLFQDDVNQSTLDDFKSPKNELQEYIQADKREPLVYKVIEEKGNGAEKTFVISVSSDGIELGVGKGHTKKEAETRAAKAALSKLAIKK